MPERNELDEGGARGEERAARGSAWADGEIATPSDGGGERSPPLRLIRHEHATFDGRFFERDPRFWPIADAARRFADRTDWPEVEDYAAAASRPLPVRFERSSPRKRGPVVRSELYDARIVRDGVVPTRPRMWHDFLNALVWATFPRAKLALHRRQHAAIERWIPAGATRLPNARTRELDALALVDEGGIVMASAPITFGHALFEGLVFGRPAMVARAIVLSSFPSSSSSPSASASANSGGQGAPEALLDHVDRALEAVLSDPRLIDTPDVLPRIRVPLVTGDGDRSG